jgi:hypothetical protein
MKTTTRIALFLLLLAVAMHGVSAQSVSECAPTGTANALAPWYCSQINQATAQVWAKWEPIGFIAVTLAFLIATIILMIGMAFKNERLRDFGTGELYEATATALIVIFFMMLSAILFGIIPAFITGPVNPYNTSLSYINSTINSTQTAIKSMYNVILVDSYYGSITLNVSFGPESSAAQTAVSSLSTVINPLANQIVQFFIIPAQVLSSLLLDGLLALSAEFYMILFFMYIAIPVFLIPGIIFRAILPLRSIGGMLIAVALSFYFIMPMLFSVAFYFTNTGVIQSINAASASITANSQGTQSQTNAVSPTSPLVTDVTALQSTMGAYFLSILFYPALILAITYYSMEVLADFIGGVAKRTGKMGLV